MFCSNTQSPTSGACHKHNIAVWILFIYWSLFIDNRSILKSENATRRKKNATTHTNTYTLFSIQEQCIERTYFTNKICTEKQNTSSDFFPSFWILIFFSFFVCDAQSASYLYQWKLVCDWATGTQKEKEEKLPIMVYCIWRSRGFVLWFTFSHSVMEYTWNMTHLLHLECWNTRNQHNWLGVLKSMIIYVYSMSQKILRKYKARADRKKNDDNKTDWQKYVRDVCQHSGNF